MIEERLYDEAIEFVTGSLTESERQQFEQKMSVDAELAGCVDELKTLFAHVSLLAPAAHPPANLRERVLNAALLARSGGPEREEQPPEIHVLPPAPRRSWIPFFPWLVASAAIILAAFAWLQTRLAIDRASVAEQAVTRVVQDLSKAEEALERIEVERKQVADALEVERENLRKTRIALADAEQRAEVAQLKVVTLTSKLNAAYVASVAWDAEHQTGILRVTRLPANAPDTAYELWVIDAATEKPMSAGVFRLSEEGSARISFKPVSPVIDASAFAISLEDSGGSKGPAPEGPIMLSGADPS